MAANPSLTRPNSNDSRNDNKDDVFSEENLQNYDMTYFRKKLWRAAEMGNSQEFVETLHLIAKKIFGTDCYSIQPFIVSNKPNNASQTSSTTNNSHSNSTTDAQAAQAQLSSILIQNPTSNNDHHNNNTNNQHHDVASDQNLVRINKIGYVEQWLDSNQSQASNDQVQTPQSGQQALTVSQQQINNDNATQSKDDQYQVNSNTTQEKAAVTQNSNNNNNNNEDQRDETEQPNSNQLPQNHSNSNGKIYTINCTTSKNVKSLSCTVTVS